MERFLQAEGFPAGQLLLEGFGAVWSVWYVPKAIRTSLSLLIALNPKDEYPEARAMRRRFILHLGGTNTGKTYAGFQQLIRTGTGIYLAPLRLLALEAQETLLDAGVDCSLSTGEEEDLREGDTHMAATAGGTPGPGPSWGCWPRRSTCVPPRRPSICSSASSRAAGTPMRCRSTSGPPL